MYEVVSNIVYKICFGTVLESRGANLAQISHAAHWIQYKIDLLVEIFLSSNKLMMGKSARNVYRTPPVVGEFGMILGGEHATSSGFKQ